MKKRRFLGGFLAAFGLLLIVWKALDGARWYTQGLLSCAAVIGPMLHGWVLETSASGLAPEWVRGTDRVQASLQFDALAVGVVPVVALIVATPGLALRRRVTLSAVGAGLCFVTDTLIVAAFPLLVFYKNAFTDVLGTFLGLIGFVGAPVIIWFCLTFHDLQRWLPSLRRDQPPAPR